MRFVSSGQGNWEMGHLNLDVLFEDNHLLVVNKPAGLATMGVTETTPSALEMARRYIKDKYDKPGKVYLGIVSRLDAVVSGVLIFARTSKAAARLTEQYRTGKVEKYYWALVDGPLDPDCGDLTGWVRKDERQRRMLMASSQASDAKYASLTYRTLKAAPRATLLEIQLHTGRKHQIRVQLAQSGHPIIGDRKYGSRSAFPVGIGLHGRRLVLEHPVQRERIEFVAPLPSSWGAASWRGLGADLGEPF